MDLILPCDETLQQTRYATRTYEMSGQFRAVIDSEFAQVRVEVDHEGNGPRLRLEDLRSGRVRYLDALELETIVWLRDEHLDELLDPSADRWREDSDEAGNPERK